MAAHSFWGMARIIWNSFTLQLKDRSLQQSLVGTTLVQPVIFTLVSVGTYVYGKKPEFGLYAIAGTGLIGLWNTNLFTSGEIVSRERRMGTLPLVMASPTPLSVVLLGKSLANALVSLLAIGMTFATGMIAFQLPLGIHDPWNFLLGLILVTISLVALGLVIGCLFVLTRNAGEFVTIGNYPVYILSGLTFPLTLLPVWTRPFSAILPTTWGNFVLNQAATTVGANLLPGHLWIVVLSVFYFGLARVLYGRVEYLARQMGSLERW